MKNKYPNKEHNYAFYGSLRSGMYNHSFHREGMEYHKTVVIPGFKLFSLGAYPCAIFTGDGDDKLTVDLFTVTGSTEYNIYRMEIGAGYEYMEVPIDGKNFGIYVYPTSSLSRLEGRNVPDGDWVKHLQSKHEKQSV